MDKQSKTLDIILEEFLQGEVASTDARIDAIRKFMEAMGAEVERYFKGPENRKSVIPREELSQLISDMADIYQAEIATLLSKRARVYGHLSSIRHAALNSAPQEECGRYSIN